MRAANRAALFFRQRSPSIRTASPKTVYTESQTLAYRTLPAKAAIPHPAIAAISREISAL